MIDTPTEFYRIIFLVGAVIVCNIFIKAFAHRCNLPALVGYICAGLLLRILDARIHFFSPTELQIFGFLAELGVITLLFRIGLESNYHGLVRQLRSASLIWFANVVLCGTLGYACSYYFFDVPLVPSLFIAVALTATSVGITVGVWKEERALSSQEGEILLDAAELDDISSVVLMALLFALLPFLQTGDNSMLLLTISRESLFIIMKLVFFGALCLVLSWPIERYVIGFFRRIESLTELMLMVAGIGFTVAALAGFLGFSIAIGAFFAGLIFSRDKDAVKIDASYDTLDELFSPFFFVGIGMSIDPAALTRSIPLGALLIAVGTIGKIAGAWLPGMLTMKKSGALLLGVSMVPRAEIALIIMKRGLTFGPSVVPVQVFNAMVMMSAATCIFAPMVMKTLLKKWPPE